MRDQDGRSIQVMVLKGEHLGGIWRQAAILKTVRLQPGGHPEAHQGNPRPLNSPRLDTIKDCDYRQQLAAQIPPANPLPSFPIIRQRSLNLHTDSKTQQGYTTSLGVTRRCPYVSQSVWCWKHIKEYCEGVNNNIPITMYSHVSVFSSFARLHSRRDSSHNCWGRFCKPCYIPSQQSHHLSSGHCACVEPSRLWNWRDVEPIPWLTRSRNKHPWVGCHFFPRRLVPRLGGTMADEISQIRLLFEARLESQRSWKI